jgi:tetratricopeptide (TPR) repeat protein
MSSIVSASLRLLLLLALACGPSDPLEEVRELHGAGRFADSIDPLRGILDQDPSQAEAALLLGRALLRTGNAGLAVWPLRKAAETPEYAVEAGLLLTEAMLESRTAHDAVREIDRVLAIDPDNPQALVLRVDANRAAGNLEESLADIDRVLEKEPGNLPVLVTRVTALIALDRIDEAGAALDTAQASFEGADVEIASPMLARLCVARALFTFQKGDRETGERHYADCAERFPTEHVAVAEIVLFYDRIGRPERATGILERAAEESEDGLFRTLLARRLGALGETEEEERLLREVRRRKRSDSCAKRQRRAQRRSRGSYWLITTLSAISSMRQSTLSSAHCPSARERRAFASPMRTPSCRPNASTRPARLQGGWHIPSFGA